MTTEKSDKRTIDIKEYVSMVGYRTQVRLTRVKGTRVIEVETLTQPARIQLAELQDALRKLEKW